MKEPFATPYLTDRYWPVTDGHRGLGPTCSSPVFSVRFVGSNRRSMSINGRKHELIMTGWTRPEGDIQLRSWLDREASVCRTI